MIYERCMEYDEKPLSQRKWQPSITRVSWQLRNEALPVFYKTSSLHFYQSSFRPTLKSWEFCLHSTDSQYLPFVKSFHGAGYIVVSDGNIGPLTQSAPYAEFRFCIQSEGRKMTVTFTRLFLMSHESCQLIDSIVRDGLSHACAPLWTGTHVLSMADGIWKSTQRLQCFRYSYWNSQTLSNPKPPSRCVYELHSGSEELQKASCMSLNHGSAFGECKCPDKSISYRAI